jgi:hypothetical protein
MIFFVCVFMPMHIFVCVEFKIVLNSNLNLLDQNSFSSFSFLFGLLPRTPSFVSLAWATFFPSASCSPAAPAQAACFPLPAQQLATGPDRADPAPFPSSVQPGSSQ